MIKNKSKLYNQFLNSQLYIKLLIQIYNNFIIRTFVGLLIKVWNSELLYDGQ